MIKIINGKRYDTEKAEFIGADSYSNSRDFHHWSEKLYRKRNGEFFLYGEGGPASKYAEVCGQNEWRGGEKIMPLGLNAAREWAENHLDAEDYEKFFGVIPDDEDDGKMTWSLSIAPSAVERVRREAGKSGKKLSEVVEDAITAYIKD